MFEVQAEAVLCPFCSFVMPVPGEKPAGSPLEGAPQDTAAPPIPDPEAVETLHVADPMVDPMPGSAAPEPEPEPVTGAPSLPAGALKLAAIAGGAFLAFKLGLLDNLLMAFGLMSPPAPPPRAVETPPAVAEPAPAPRAAIPPPEPLPSLEPAAPEVPAVPAPPPPPAKWTFEGRVYDMMSLKPVKGAVLLFMTQSEEETFEANTDDQGRYRIVVPSRPRGFKIVVDHVDYISEYFDEADPPYRSWTTAKRRQLRAAKPVHKAWTAAGAAPARRNIVLFPDIMDR